MATLNGVIEALGAGEYQANTIQEYFDEVVAFLKDAGVSEANITDGVVARGVSDLWNYEAGGGKLSEYFKVRAAQLALKR